MAFEVYHMIDQVIFKWELLVILVTDNARSISKTYAPSQSFPLFIRSNVDSTWVIAGRVDRVQALHD